MNRRSLVGLSEAAGMIDSVVSAASITTELVAQYVRAMENAFSDAKVKTLHHLVDGAVEALEFRVTPDTPFLNIPLKELQLKSGILLAGIVRQNGQIIIPMGGDSLQIGDDVIVVTAGKGIQDLRDILL